jgi:hypothetical protein
MTRSAPRRPSTEAPARPPATSVTPAALKRQALRNALLGTVELLQHRQAEQINAKLIDDYVALDWFEWRGGALQITQTGQNICKQIRSGLI